MSPTMEPNLILLFLFFSLVIVNSARIAPSLSPLAQPRIAPSLSPFPQPIPAPSPSETLDDFNALSESEYDSDVEPMGMESPDSKVEPMGMESPDSKRDSVEPMGMESPDSQKGSDSPSDSVSVQTLDVDFHSSPELKKICDQTDHSSLCLATVQPLAKDSSDVNSVLQLAVKASSVFAEEALSEAKKLASQPGTPENVVSTIKDCEDGYGTAVENFQKALEAFHSNDMGTMRTMLSAVITFIGDCQDEFAEMQVQSPLAGYSEKLTEMASNCLAISSIETH